MKLFDSHAHLDFDDIGVKVNKMVAGAFESGLEGIISIAGSQKAGDFDLGLKIGMRYENIWTAAGIHPHASSFATLDTLDKLRHALDSPCIVALGETGLDYHYNHSSPREQRVAFAEQIKMALLVNLPVVVHTREAEYDTIAIMSDEGAMEAGGVIHCFSGSRKMAEKLVNDGFYISFSGSVTFKNALQLQEVAAWVPEDRILAETDSPFLSPVPFRGKWPNEPKRVRHVVEKLAEIRNVKPEEMAERIFNNTTLCFKLENV